MADRLLDVEAAAALLGTTERFPRRLIEERRIEFVKIGSHVRIRESALNAYIEQHTIAPVQRIRRGRRAA
ncbi:MAG: excisionase family DNA-binding protein [Pseudonocardiaceae bacterium]